jgi:hypothetical protein
MNYKLFFLNLFIVCKVQWKVFTKFQIAYCSYSEETLLWRFWLTLNMFQTTVRREQLAYGMNVVGMSPGRLVAGKC